MKKSKGKNKKAIELQEKPMSLVRSKAADPDARCRVAVSSRHAIHDQEDV